MSSKSDAEIDISESKDIKKDSKVAEAALDFSEEWFTKIFEKYPLLLKFLTTNIQTSSDQTDPTKSPAQWQKILYEALRATLKTDIARHYELERTILSIMFFEALQHSDEEALTFVKDHGSNLNREDLHNIRALVNLRFTEISARDKENIIISFIFGDVGKINAIRNAFEKYGLVTQDQDLAHDYMLGLDTDLLSEFFKLSTAQIEYLKEGVFPLHLGHAVQAECTEKKFTEIAEFLQRIPEKYREAVINAALFKQIMDVAGARGQNGTLLLNRAILNNYLTFKKVLLELAQTDTRPKQIYWNFATKIIRDSKISFIEEEVNQMEEAKDVDAFSKKGLIWRLVIQLRIPQTAPPEDAKRQAQTVEKAVDLALKNNTKFQEAVVALQKYNKQAPHTFTYGPAILSTLKNQSNLREEAAAATYAAIFGVIIQGMACNEYLALAKNNPDLLQSPLNFNELNKQLAADITLAQALVSGTALLEINEDGVVKIASLNLETKKAHAETKRSQLGEKISDYYRKFGLLSHPVQQRPKAEEKIPEQAPKKEAKAPAKATRSAWAELADILNNKKQRKIRPHQANTKVRGLAPILTFDKTAMDAAGVDLNEVKCVLESHKRNFPNLIPLLKDLDKAIRLSYTSASRTLALRI